MLSPLFGVILLYILSYLYFELVSTHIIEWKSFIIRTSVFLLYFPVYIALNNLISVNNYHILFMIVPFIFFIDITVYVTLKYYKRYYTIK